MSDPGEHLKAMRERKGMSVRGAARETGLSPSFISNIENGKRSLSMETARSLLDAYGATPEEAGALLVEPEAASA